MDHGVEHRVKKKKNQEIPAEHTQIQILTDNIQPSLLKAQTLNAANANTHTRALTHTHTQTHGRIPEVKKPGWQNPTWDDPLSPVPEAGDGG